MKKALLTFLIFVGLIPQTFAKDETSQSFFDVGVNAHFNPGASIIGDYKPIPFLGVGFGLQGYQFYSNYVKKNCFVPALIFDVRLYKDVGDHGQIYVFGNIGSGFSTPKYTNAEYSVESKFRLTAAGGVGYSYKWFYISLKGVGINEKAKFTEYSGAQYTKKEWNTSSDYNIILSVGFTLHGF